MKQLHTLKNTTRPKVRSKRVGRGIGSGVGKTCGRGEKGDGSRSGYRRRWGKEGGQMPLFMKTPIRGFSNKPFQKRLAVVNLKQIDALYEDGETVNQETLRAKGFISGKIFGIKVLGQGELTKKVTLEVNAVSDQVREKLQKANIPCHLS